MHFLFNDQEMRPFLASFDAEECIDFTQDSEEQQKDLKNLNTEDTIRLIDEYEKIDFSSESLDDEL